MSWTITGTIVDPDGTPADGAIVAIVSPTPSRSTSGKLIDNDRVAIPVSGGQVDDVALESVPGATWTFMLPRRQRVEIADPGDGAVVNLAADIPAGRPLTPDEASLLRAEIARIQAEGLKGDKGDKGDVGPVGPAGPTGPASKLTVGTVTTGAPGSQAAATLTGTAPNQTLGLTIPQGPQGPAGQPTAYELRGTGSPYGVVTPPTAGTYYTDTAGTTGAWRWISTGTTTTSWVVQHGDTGWRRFPLQNGWTEASGGLLVRRQGSIVTIQGGADGGKSTSGLLAGDSLPSGFGVGSSIAIAPVWDDSAYAWRLIIISKYGCNVDQTPRGVTFFSTSYVTSDPWPSTLPGSPA